MDKQSIYQCVLAKADLICHLSDRIWEFAEISMQEHRSTAAYVEILKAEGFTVTENLCGIPTAFSGSYGNGKPVIGILGEYDALSGLSQKACSTAKDPLIPGGNGHGCGHNLLGAASLGAAIAIKEQIQSGKLSGTVIFYGCPGEEGCAGKTFMARDGMFRDLDAALCWHPGDTNEVTVTSSAACLQLEYTFTGLAAHAAGDPEHGRSALDGAELMNIGVQFLREHMSKSCSIHYSFVDAGGISPNVVQPTAKMLYMVRSDTVKNAKALLKRVNDIAKGAALMSGTQVSCRQIDGTANTVPNHTMEQLIYENLQQAPLPVYSEDETAFATALRLTYDCSQLPGERTREDVAVRNFVMHNTQGGKKALNDFIMPYAPSMALSPGSTDVGDVSWLTPTAQFTAVTWASCSPGHSWQNVATGRHSIAHKGIILAAQVLAGTAADLMTQPQTLEKAREEFSLATADGYDCPIGPEVIPN